MSKIPVVESSTRTFQFIVADEGQGFASALTHFLIRDQSMLHGKLRPTDDDTWHDSMIEFVSGLAKAAGTLSFVGRIYCSALGLTGEQCSVAFRDVTGTGDLIVTTTVYARPYVASSGRTRR